MRLIDADKLTAESKLIISIVSLVKSCHMKHKSGCFTPDCNECMSRFFNHFHSHLAPTVDADPVQHGQWDKIWGGDYSCSLCHSIFSDDDSYKYVLNNFKYCPNCGAKMDGSESK